MLVERGTCERQREREREGRLTAAVAAASGLRHTGHSVTGVVKRLTYFWSGSETKEKRFTGKYRRDSWFGLFGSAVHSGVFLGRCRIMIVVRMSNCIAESSDRSHNKDRRFKTKKIWKVNDASLDRRTEQKYGRKIRRRPIKLFKIQLTRSVSR